MAWIESHQSLGKHPKLFRLAVELRIPKAQAVGHLQYLWWWALDYAPMGVVSVFTPAEISAGSEWQGDPDKFFTALKSTGWIDPDGTLHDWMEYAGACMLSRERQRAYRRRQGALRNGNVTVTATQPTNLPTNQPEKKGNPPLPPIPDDLKANETEIRDWLAYKRERGETYKPRGLAALWGALRRIPQAQRREAVDQSMSCNYAGLFPPKNGAKIGDSLKVPATPGKYAKVAQEAK